MSTRDVITQVIILKILSVMSKLFSIKSLENIFSPISWSSWWSSKKSLFSAPFMSSRHTFRAPGPDSLFLLEQSFLLLCNLVSGSRPTTAAPSSLSEQKPFDELIAFARMPLPMPPPCLCLPNHNINFHVWLSCPATIHIYLWLMLWALDQLAELQ